MNEIVIEAEGLSKKFYIGKRLEKFKTLRDTIAETFTAPLRKAQNLLRGHATGAAELNEEIWALQDVSFTVRRGEVLGIIGRNGAGKSTLLKILTRITEPTKGYAEIRGRVGSLLEVGTGFHPELTGRENVFLNGAILGMQRAEIENNFDEIVAFAEVERFIDTPVKHYSSGMYLRLAFAVAAHLETEILLVDEVLAVGDTSFQKKCLGKMEEVGREGRTVLFVSHNMAAIRQLCSTCLWIDDGSIKEIEAPEKVIASYLNCSNGRSEPDAVFFDQNIEKDFQLRSVRLINQEGNPKQDFDCDGPVIVELGCQVHRPVPGLYGYLSILKKDGTTVMVSDSFDTLPNPLDNLSVGMHKMHITIPGRTLGHGHYVIYLNFSSRFSMTNFNVDSPGNVCSFYLSDFTSHRGNRRRGFFSTQLSWSLTQNPSATVKSSHILKTS
jgi:lipopolysaccharide transport system ATP-binding protein